VTKRAGQTTKSVPAGCGLVGFKTTHPKAAEQRLFERREGETCWLGREVITKVYIDTKRKETKTLKEEAIDEPMRSKGNAQHCKKQFLNTG